MIARGGGHQFKKKMWLLSLRLLTMILARVRLMKSLQVVDIDTYDDHRMAMAFALVACAPTPLIINDPGCVRKTYPYYFSVLDQVSVKEEEKD